MDLDDDDDTDFEIKTVQKKDVKEKIGNSSNGYMTCPECGEEAMLKTEGCVACHNCGYSKCS